MCISGVIPKEHINEYNTGTAIAIVQSVPLRERWSSTVETHDGMDERTGFRYISK